MRHPGTSRAQGASRPRCADTGIATAGPGVGRRWASPAGTGRLRRQLVRLLARFGVTDPNRGEGVMRCTRSRQDAIHPRPCETSSEGGGICPEPDSNRHGVASEGFSYPLQLSLLGARGRPFGVWTFSLPWSAARGPRTLGRGRQVSTLSRAAGRPQQRGSAHLAGLARDCRHRRGCWAAPVGLVPRI